MIPPIDGAVPQPPAAPGGTGVGTRPASPALEAAAVSAAGVAADVLPGMPASDRSCALALLLAALATSEAVAPRLRQDVAGILARAGRLLPAPQAELLARLLQPLAAGPHGGEAREALRERIEASGVFLDARLRLALQALPGASDAELVRRLPPDIRALLSAVVREAASLRGASNADETHAAGVAAGGRDSLPSAEGEVEAAQRTAADAVLRQQAEVACRWLDDGTLAFDLPVRLAAEEARVFVEFQGEGRDGGGERQRKKSVLRIHIDSGVFGPVAVEARWRSAACEARFSVSNEAACAALRGEAESLRAALGPVFPNVAVEVVLDVALAGRRPPDHRPAPPPGGSVVSVRI